MANRAQKRPRLVGSEDLSDAAASPRNRSLVNQVDQAYERIEEMLVNCQLKPGRFLAMQDLQELVSFGRTPIHQAISRLAADTLVIVRPRHGVQIAPIDLARERRLLPLRRDIERFVIRLAAERAGPAQRNQMLHLMRVLREQREHMTINKFNVLDRRIDQLVMASAEEPYRGSHVAAACIRSSAASAGCITRKLQEARICNIRSTAMWHSSTPSPIAISRRRSQRLTI